MEDNKKNLGSLFKMYNGYDEYYKDKFLDFLCRDGFRNDDFWKEISTVVSDILDEEAFVKYMADQTRDQQNDALKPNHSPSIGANTNQSSIFDGLALRPSYVDNEIAVNFNPPGNSTGICNSEILQAPRSPKPVDEKSQINKRGRKPQKKRGRDSEGVYNNQPLRKITKKLDNANIKCDECNKEFKKQRELKEHQQRFQDENGEDTKDRCLECDYVTDLKCDMQMHIRKNHPGLDSGPYQCIQNAKCNGIFKKDDDCGAFTKAIEHVQNAHYRHPKPMEYLNRHLKKLSE